MKMRKFTASTMKEALQQVKDELGPEAMVISTRTVQVGREEQIEITAATDDEPQAPQTNPGDFQRVLSELEGLRRQMTSAVRTPPALRSEIETLRHLVATARAGLQPDYDALETIADAHPLAAPSRKRVVALVGPTGVGKTTTIAKLAAKAALVQNRSVALITLDAYRVGGQEQMAIFADLIGVPLVSVRRPSKLKSALESLKDVERVFIDTAGRSPSAAEEIRETVEAIESLDRVEVHLTLPAATQPATTDKWAEIVGRKHIDRLLFTKLDECDGAPELIRAPGRLRIPVAYLTTGQRVPEDLELAEANRLLQWARPAPQNAEAA